MGQRGVILDMPLALYRRHRQECNGGHEHNSRTSEYEERKKGWRRCDCPIFASGTLRKAFKRQNTGQWEFEAARAVAKSGIVHRHWGASTWFLRLFGTQGSHRVDFGCAPCG